MDSGAFSTTFSSINKLVVVVVVVVVVVNIPTSPFRSHHPRDA